MMRTLVVSLVKFLGFLLFVTVESVLGMPYISTQLAILLLKRSSFSYQLGWIVALSLATATSYVTSTTVVAVWICAAYLLFELLENTIRSNPHRYSVVGLVSAIAAIPLFSLQLHLGSVILFIVEVGSLFVIPRMIKRYRSRVTTDLEWWST